MSNTFDAEIRPALLPVECGEILAVSRHCVSNELLDVSPTVNGFVLSRKCHTKTLSWEYPLTAADIQHCSTVFVAVAMGEVIGWCGCVNHQWNRTMELQHLYVDIDYRNCGIGSRLLTSAINHAAKLLYRNLWVETQNTNVKAYDFYIAKGFELRGLNLDLYDPHQLPFPQSALYMVMNIEQPPA